MFGKSGPVSFPSQQTSGAPVISNPFLSKKSLQTIADQESMKPHIQFGSNTNASSDVVNPFLSSFQDSRASESLASPSHNAVAQFPSKQNFSGDKPFRSSNNNTMTQKHSEIRGPKGSDKQSKQSQITQDTLGHFYGPNVCRICGIQLSNDMELKAHIKSENHYVTSHAQTANISSGFQSQESPPFVTPHKHHPTNRSQYQAPSINSNRLSNTLVNDNSIIQPKKRFPLRSTDSLEAMDSHFSDTEVISNNSKSKIQTAATDQETEIEPEQHNSRNVMNDISDREKQLRELLKNKLKSSKSLSVPSISDHSSSPPIPQSKEYKVTSIKQKVKSFNEGSISIAKDTVNDIDDFDRGRRPDGRALCEDMCPEEERIRRSEEYGALHELEKNTPEMPEFATLQQTMIKRFQKSAADHELNIPELVRTPRALLKTIVYIEDNLMDLFENYDPEGITPIVVYLFIWDRFRMIAKDYTIMNSALGVNAIWIECHERMARWYVYMDHRMKCEEDYVKAGHGQQNGESLNNIFKTLFSLYTISETCDENGPLPTPNKGELVGYFIIFQIGNKGEMTKFLQQLSDDYFDSKDVQYAIQVWRAIKSENYVLFFSLLQSAPLLHACMMHKYVSEVRMMALRKMCKSYAVPGANGAPGYYPISQLTQLLMFEDEDETREFLDQCGIEIDEHESEDGPCMLLENQNVYSSLTVDKNNNPILPVARYMWNGIESKRIISQSSSERDTADDDESGEKDSQEERIAVKDICRGFASSQAKRFNDDLCLSQLSHSLPNSAHADSSNNMASDGVDDYELSSQDSDEDAAAPFQLLPDSSENKKVVASPTIRPPDFSGITRKKIVSEDASAPKTAAFRSSGYSLTDTSLSIKPVVIDTKGKLANSENQTEKNAQTADSPTLKPPFLGRPDIGFSSMASFTGFRSESKTSNTLSSSDRSVNNIVHTSASIADNLTIKPKESTKSAVELKAPSLATSFRSMPMPLSSFPSANDSAFKSKSIGFELLSHQLTVNEENEKRMKEAEAIRRLQQKQLAEAQELENRRRNEQQIAEELRQKQIAIEVEQQRLKQQQDQELLEKRRDESLETLLYDQLRKKATILIQNCFQRLRRYSNNSRAEIRLVCLRLYWNLIRRIYLARTRNRNDFFNTLASINIRPIASLPTDSSRNSMKQSLRKRKLIEDCLDAGRRRSELLKPHRQSPNHVLSMTLALDALLSESIRTLNSKSNPLLFMEYFTPINLPVLFGPTLLRQQINRVADYRSDESTHSLNNQWNHSLFLKIACFSSCSSRLHWNDMDDFACNLIRLLLCTHSTNLPSESVLGHWSEIVDCSTTGSSIQRREVNVSVVDIGVDYEDRQWTIDNADYMRHCPLAGSQLILLVLPLNSQSTWQDLSYLSDLKRLINKSRPVVIIVTRTTIMSQSASCRHFRISLTARDDEMSIVYRSAIERFCSTISLDTLRVVCAFAIESTNQISLNSNSSSPLSFATTCRQCLHDAFNCVIVDPLCNVNFPLLQGLHVRSFLKQCLIPSIWAYNVKSITADFESRMFRSLAIKLEDCLVAFQNLLSHEDYKTDFPAADFSTSREDNSVRGCLFENLTGEPMMIRCNWQTYTNYTQPLRKIFNILSSYLTYFESNSLSEFLDRLNEMEWPITNPKTIATLSPKEKMRYLQRIVETLIDAIDDALIVIAIPNGFGERDNILAKLLLCNMNDTEMGLDLEIAKVRSDEDVDESQCEENAFELMQSSVENINNDSFVNQFESQMILVKQRAVDVAIDRANPLFEELLNHAQREREISNSFVRQLASSVEVNSFQKNSISAKESSFSVRACLDLINQSKNERVAAKQEILGLL